MFACLIHSISRLDLAPLPNDATLQDQRATMYRAVLSCPSVCGRRACRQVHWLSPAFVPPGSFGHCCLEPRGSTAPFQRFHKDITLQLRSILCTSHRIVLRCHLVRRIEGHGIASVAVNVSLLSVLGLHFAFMSSTEIRKHVIATLVDLALWLPFPSMWPAQRKAGQVAMSAREV
jgi:hypothetical protein